MEYIILALSAITLALIAVILIKKPKEPDARLFEDAARKALADILAQTSQESRSLREELDRKLDRLRDSLTAMQADIRDAQQKAIGELTQKTGESLEKLRTSTDERLNQ